MAGRLTLAVQASSGSPPSQLYRVVHRIAARFEPGLRDTFLAVIRRLQDQMEQAELLAALISREQLMVEAAARIGQIGVLLSTSGQATILQGVIRATGSAGAEVLSDATGISFRFNAVDSNVVLYARQQTAQLVVAVTEEVRDTIRQIITVGEAFGITPAQQATAIRQVVGLPPNWAAAPLHLAQELRAGRFTSTRRLSATDKAQIRSRLKNGTITEDFIAKMQERYAASLTRRRALNIARTESIRAANYGQRLNWRQALKAGVLPKTARRMWIVTPDDRLRDTHAAVPGLNPEGVPIQSGAYRTPLGPSEGPPLEVNCRCSEGLIFPGLQGVL